MRETMNSGGLTELSRRLLRRYSADTLAPAPEGAVERAIARACTSIRPEEDDSAPWRGAAKWIGLSLLVSLVSLGGWGVQRQTMSERGAPMPEAPGTRPEPRSAGGAGGAAEVASISEFASAPLSQNRPVYRVSDLPNVTSRGQSEQGRTGKVTAGGGVAGSFADELGRLEHARRTLNSGDAASALREVSAYEREFQQRSFLPEMLVVRIEALYALRRAAEGGELAGKFLAAYPSSPYVERVRSLLQSSSSSVEPCRSSVNAVRRGCAESIPASSNEGGHR